jgi:hypothetical protein
MAPTRRILPPSMLSVRPSGNPSVADTGDVATGPCPALCATGC